MKAFLAIVALVLAGCTRSQFYQHHSGEYDIVGIRVPTSETTTSQLEIFHHLNGEVLSVKDPADIRHRYSVKNNNSYFGMVYVDETIEGEISVTITNKTEGAAK